MDPKSALPEQMPSSIGRYQVQESIGFGAMGAVYKAFDPLIKRTLAIKTIRLDIPRNSPQYKSFIERFYHEARISGTLSHPNIVTLFDIGEEGGVPYLAMEYVEGETVSSLVERGTKFPPEKVVSLVSQVASAIDYAHSKGVIHRDIKPSNMILSEGDRVKVTDFGIAKLVDSEMTQSGTLLGTPSYMSPEQAMGEKLDGRSDIFSLGVCAFEMLSGEQPFPGANVTSILYKLVHVEPVEPQSLEMHGLVPQKWHEVFGKVLAKKPDDRYQTAAEFVADLEFCLGSWFGGVGAETLSEASAAQAVAGAAREAVAAGAEAEMATQAIAAEQIRVTERTAPMPASAVPAAGPPASKASPQEEPATVLMGAPQMATVAMPSVAKAPTVPGTRPAGAPPPRSPEVTLKAPAPPATVKAPAVEDAATARVSVSTAKAPRPPAPPPPAPPPPPRVAPPPPAPVPVAPGARSGAPRSGISPVVVLGGAAVFFVVALGLAGYMVWKRSQAEPVPTPVVESTPTPPPSTHPPLVATGLIRVETTPPGALISVNGEARGNSPLEVPGLAVGNYEVRAELKGYDTKAETVTILAGSPHAQVSLALARSAPVTGSVEIVSQPAGADVTVDGNRAGQTPLADLKLRPGSHRIEITAEGHEPWSGGVNVEPGKRARVEATLREIPKATPTPGPPPVDPTRVYLNTAADVDVLAKKIAGGTASYPSNAPRLKSGDSVSVSVTFVVDENGDVDEPKVVETGGAVIDEAVLKAVRKWKYSPAVKQGIKVKVKIAFKQTFRAG
ncbi:MAG TPA: TonB family protein [Vicinamibacteria bacterium]|nr:TonB family protein [Vicinamibacteria bacterium]